MERDYLKFCHFNFTWSYSCCCTGLLMDSKAGADIVLSCLLTDWAHHASTDSSDLWLHRWPWLNSVCHKAEHKIWSIKETCRIQETFIDFIRAEIFLWGSWIILMVGFQSLESKPFVQLQAQLTCMHRTMKLKTENKKTQMFVFP